MSEVVIYNHDVLKAECGSSLKLYRLEDQAGTMFVVRGSVVMEEICKKCYLQGNIWRVHDESEAHHGSPHFRPQSFSSETFSKLRAENDALRAEIENLRAHQTH